MKQSSRVSKSSYRVAFLTNIPGPYRGKMIEAWASVRSVARLMVFYTDAGDQGRGWSNTNLKGVAETRLTPICRIPHWGFLNFGLLNLVLKSDVVVIGGFEQASYFVAAMFAVLLRRRLVISFDGFSPARFGTEPPFAVWLKKCMAMLASAALANGTVSVRYLDSILGARKLPKFNQFLCGNTTEIQETWPKKDLLRTQFRSFHGIDDHETVVMCCCYIEQRKRIDVIVNALKHGEIPKPVLLVVGNGSMKEEIYKYAVLNGVRCVFTGFLEGERLAQSYFGSDIFILASDDDPWGLVVHEAMLAGLPIVVSDACGCSLDFAIDGENGYVFERGNWKSAAKQLAACYALPIVERSRASRSIALNWNLTRAAEEFNSCVINVTERAMKVSHGS